MSARLAAALAAFLLLTLAGAVRAQEAGLAAGGFGSGPLDIEADNGIEWQQNNQVYIARGNAKASRGNAAVYADTLIAHYRAAANAPKQDNSQTPLGGTEIYRVEADGHVRITNPSDTVFGDHAIYDLDTATAVVTGKHLRLVTPTDTLTARDSLEWYDRKQLAVARGDAVAARDGKRLAGDVLVAQVEKPPNAPARIGRIDAHGHVLVSTPTEVARGDTGVYDADTGIATLAGGVTITRGDQDTARGQYAVVDLNNNVSRLLSGPPGARNAGSGPVEALIVPRSSGKPGERGRSTRSPKAPQQ